MNNNGYKQRELMYLFQTDSLCVHDKKIFFSAKNYDALVCIDMQNYTCYIEKQFLNKFQTSYCAHSKIISYKNYIYCIPRYSSNIIKYNMIARKIEIIDIPNSKNDRSLFTDAILIGDNILCFPEFFSWIIAINLKTDEITYIKEIKEVNKDEYKFASNAEIKKNKIVIPLYNSNKLLTIDTNNYGITTKVLQFNGSKCINIACTDEILCLIDIDYVCYVLNKEGRLLIKIKDIDAEVIGLDDIIWLIDKKSKKIYTIEYDNSVQYVEYKIKTQEIHKIKSSEWIKTVIMHEYILILMISVSGEVGVFMCNGNEQNYKKLQIDNFYKEFMQEKLFFQEHINTELPIMDIITYSKQKKHNSLKNIGEIIYNMIDRTNV